MSSITPQNLIEMSEVTEIFSRFLTRLLENDSKFSIYQKEWDSFKTVLNTVPLNRDDIYIQLARVQLNLEKLNSSPPMFSSRAESVMSNDSNKASAAVPFIKILPTFKNAESGHFDFSSPPKHNINTSPTNRNRSASELKSRPSVPARIESSFKPSTFSNQPGVPPRAPLSSRDEKPERYDAPIVHRNTLNAPHRQGDNVYAKRNSVAVGQNINITFLTPTTFTDFASESMNLSNVSEITNSHTEFKNESTGSILDVQPPKKAKYDLTYLVSKARRFNETVTADSDKLISHHFTKIKTGVPGGYEFPEERTPLRRIVVYSHQNETKTSEMSDNLKEAMDQLAGRLQTNAKAMPFNNALISY